MTPMRAPARDCRRLYGLDIESDLPLPCPPADGDAPDVTLRWLGLTPPPSGPLPVRVPDWARAGDHWVLHYHDADENVLEFLVEPDGSGVAVRHCSDRSWPDFLPSLLGPALCAVLNLRGCAVLHGGAVCGEGGAVLLLGQSESGKSTLTAAMVAAGAPLLCEELAVLFMEDDLVGIHPGHRLIKLSPSSVVALGMTPSAAPAVYPDSHYTDQRWVDATTLAGGHHNAPEALGVVYLLAGRREGLGSPEIEPLGPAEACLSLRGFLKQSQMSRPPAETMRLCASIAAAAPLRRVWLPEGLDTISSCARVLLDDARVVAADRRATTTAGAPRCGP
jgi:hypothetical protein